MDRRRLPVLSLGVLLSFLLAAGASAQVRTIQGRAVTGINRILGEPYFDLGAPFGTIGFFTVGAHNPLGGEALPLTAASPASTVLATAVDPFFLAVFGAPPPDPALLNLRLRDVPVIVSPTGDRGPIGALAALPQLAQGRAPSLGTITLGRWMQASGAARIRCTAGSVPRIEFSFSGLVPRGLYSAWGGMLTPQGPAPVPLGGLPNVFAADDQGKAGYTALLNYCPLALRPGEVPLAFIDIVLHSDHAVYAGVPELFAAGMPPGIVTQVHVEFAVSAKPVQ